MPVSTKSCSPILAPIVLCYGFFLVFFIKQAKFNKIHTLSAKNGLSFDDKFELFRLSTIILVHITYTKKL